MKHFSDEEIQQLALEGAIDSEQSGHLQSCMECQLRVADYRLLITAIREQPVPSLEIDLSEMVLAKLPVSRPAQKKSSIEEYLPALAIVAGIGLFVYIFRKWLVDIFQGITFVSICTILVTVFTVLVFFCTDMWSTYRKRMNALDLY